MFPIIGKIGPFTIYSYGVMMALAVIVCTSLLSRDARKIGISSETIIDLVFWSILMGILGSRVFYILLNIPYYLDNPLEVFMVWKGGLAFQGGLIGAFGFGLYYVKLKKLILSQILDLVAPYVALGQAIGRVGCYLNGCCYGKLFSESWISICPILKEQIHPTQLYLSLGALAIFFVLKNYQKKNHLPGQVFVFYIFLDASWRFLVEFFRADHESTLLGLSVFQFVCLGLIGIAIYVNSHLKSRTRR